MVLVTPVTPEFLYAHPEAPIFGRELLGAIFATAVAAALAIGFTTAIVFRSRGTITLPGCAAIFTLVMIFSNMFAMWFLDLNARTAPFGQAYCVFRLLYGLSMTYVIRTFVSYLYVEDQPTQISKMTMAFAYVVYATSVIFQFFQTHEVIMSGKLLKASETAYFGLECASLLMMQVVIGKLLTDVVNAVAKADQGTIARMDQGNENLGNSVWWMRTVVVLALFLMGMMPGFICFGLIVDVVVNVRMVVWVYLTSHVIVPTVIVYYTPTAMKAADLISGGSGKALLMQSSPASRV